MKKEKDAIQRPVDEIVKHSISHREHDTPEKECLQMISDVAIGYDGF